MRYFVACVNKLNKFFILGSIFVMDFNKDSYDVGIPEEFRADYDNIAGYDYNIDLIAPYDDVNTMNLPKI